MKSLKEQNRWRLAAVVGANSLILYGVVQANAIKLTDVRSALENAQNLLPVGVAVVVGVVINGLISPDMKARLVFLRWRNALPGHRAFTEYGARDPRVDLAALARQHGSPLPVDAAEQNRVWYRMYTTVEADPSVRQNHRDFLLLRDYTGLSILFIVFYGTAALVAIGSKQVALTYILLLIGQFLIVRQAASNYGSRLVTTVLARLAATTDPAGPTLRRGRR